MPNFGALARALASYKRGSMQGEDERTALDMAQQRQAAQESERLFGQWARRKEFEDTAANREAQRQYLNQAREDAQAAARENLQAQLQDRAQSRAEAAAQQAERDKAQREFVGQQNELNRQNQRELRALMAASAAQRAAQGPPPKPVPNAVATAFLNNQKQLQTIDAAMEEVRKNPSALGAKAWMPDVLLNRLPSQTMAGGVEARAGVSDVGSLVIHDRTGAAMSASEWKRLKGFIPKDTDDAATALKKLARMRAIVAEETGAMKDFYTPEQGYRGLPEGVSGGAVPAKPRSPRDVP